MGDVRAAQPSREGEGTWTGRHPISRPCGRRSLAARSVIGVFFSVSACKNSTPRADLLFMAQGAKLEVSCLFVEAKADTGKAANNLPLCSFADSESASKQPGPRWSQRGVCMTDPEGQLEAAHLLPEAKADKDTSKSCLSRKLFFVSGLLLPHVALMEMLG